MRDEHGIEAEKLAREYKGGIKAVVAAERAARNPAKEEARDPLADIAERLVLASVEFATGLEPGELVVLLGRATGEGTVDIVASVANDRGLAARTLKAAK